MTEIFWPKSLNPVEISKGSAEVPSMPTITESEIQHSPKETIGPPVNTGDVQATTRFQQGLSGNPKGRPKGSRNRFTEAFMQAIADDFSHAGAEAIAAVRSNDPEAYLRLLIPLLSKSHVARFDDTLNADFSTMTDDELVSTLNYEQRRKFIERAVKAVDDT